MEQLLGVKRNILIYFLFCSINIFAQNINTKTIEGFFLLEDKYLAYNIYTDADVIVQTPAFIKASDYDKLYQNEFYELNYQNHLNQLLNSDKKNYEFFMYLCEYDKNFKASDGMPMDSFLIDVKGLKYFLIYLKIEISNAGFQNRYVPKYSKCLNKYIKKRKKMRVYKIERFLDYKVFSPISR